LQLIAAVILPLTILLVAIPKNASPEALTLIGAQLEIISTPGKGTHVKIHLPTAPLSPEKYGG
jgi:hypothetical protein